MSTKRNVILVLPSTYQTVGYLYEIFVLLTTHFNNTTNTRFPLFCVNRIQNFTQPVCRLMKIVVG